MSLDTMAILHMSLANIIGAKTTDAMKEALGTKDTSITDLLTATNVLLQRLLDETSTDDNPDLVEPFTLAGTQTSYYEVPAWKRNHLCMIIPSGVTISYQVMGMTVITKTITNGGWYQLDLPQATQIWASANTPVYIRWCDNALGQVF